MVQKTLVIQCKNGLHIRPCSYLHDAATKHALLSAYISNKDDSVAADMTSIINIMSIANSPGFKCGDTITITLDGREEGVAMDKIKNVLNVEDWDNLTVQEGVLCPPCKC